MRRVTIVARRASYGAGAEAGPQLWARAGRGGGAPIALARAARLMAHGRRNARIPTWVAPVLGSRLGRFVAMPLANDHRQLPAGRVAQAIVLAT
jgi:hypothetical protein